MKLNKGDIVRPFDGSYSLGIRGNGRFYARHGIDLKKHEFEVIATDCKLPAENSLSEIAGCQTKYNDTILRDVKSDEIVFIQSDLVKKVEEEKSNSEIIKKLEMVLFDEYNNGNICRIEFLNSKSMLAHIEALIN